jgi:hypothetical protein
VLLPPLLLLLLPLCWCRVLLRVQLLLHRHCLRPSGTPALVAAAGQNQVYV